MKSRSINFPEKWHLGKDWSKVSKKIVFECHDITVRRKRSGSLRSVCVSLNAGRFGLFWISCASLTTSLFGSNSLNTLLCICPKIASSSRHCVFSVFCLFFFASFFVLTFAYIFCSSLGRRKMYSRSHFLLSFPPPSSTFLFLDILPGCYYERH